MADILILGMEMPKNGYECPMNSFGICHVATDGDNCECYDVRADWCPLLPLPEKHGRLIDWAALIKRMCNHCDGACDLVGCDAVACTRDCRCDLRKAIDAAPTIIPSEGGGEDG